MTKEQEAEWEAAKARGEQLDGLWDRTERLAGTCAHLLAEGFVEQATAHAAEFKRLREQWRELTAQQ